MRLLAELEMAGVLALSACAAVPDQGTFQDRLYRFANAAADRGLLMEPSRVHSPVLCQGFVNPVAYTVPFRSGADYARARDLCIRH